jgi:hypothetical protein
MAARSPTAFTTQNIARNYAPRKKILAAPIDAIIEDQHFFLAKNDILLWDCFCPYEFNSVDATENTNVFRFYLPLIDRCGCAALTSGAEEKIDWYVLAKYDGTHPHYHVTLYNDTLSTSSELTLTNTTWTWQGPGSLQCKADGTVNTLRLGANLDFGNHFMWIAGIAAFGNYTAT